MERDRLWLFREIKKEDEVTVRVKESPGNMVRWRGSKVQRNKSSL